MKNKKGNSDLDALVLIAVIVLVIMMSGSFLRGITTDRVPQKFNNGDIVVTPFSGEEKEYMITNNNYSYSYSDKIWNYKVKDKEGKTYVLKEFELKEKISSK